jgi:hypothetical protein
MKAMTSLNVTRSKAAASCTTKTSQSQSPKAAGLSTVHFLHGLCFKASLATRNTCTNTLLSRKCFLAEKIGSCPSRVKGRPSRALSRRQLYLRQRTYVSKRHARAVHRPNAAHLHVRADKRHSGIRASACPGNDGLTAGPPPPPPAPNRIRWRAALRRAPA